MKVRPCLIIGDPHVGLSNAAILAALSPHETVVILGGDIIDGAELKAQEIKITVDDLIKYQREQQNKEKKVNKKEPYPFHSKFTRKRGGYK